MPKVSICIPTYNRSHYLRYSIFSVLNQTYTDFELIICDDGSTDNTAEVVNSYNEPRINYIRHPQNIGRSRNMRSGFDAATGDYFIKFDDDDGLTPEFLEKTVNILDNHPQIDFVCTNHWIINKNSEKVESATQENSLKWGKSQLQNGLIPDLLWQTFSHQSLQVGSTLFRRECLKDVDYMRPQADGCEDFDLLVRLAIAGKQGYFLPEYLMEYRFHGGQTSLKQGIHFLKAKNFCINSYHFTDEKLEQERLKKLAITQQSLGFKLIEKGDTEEGRRLLEKSSEMLGTSQKTNFGLFLSYFPVKVRRMIFDLFRKIRPKDYTEQVRIN
ncbi:glycosyl transferase family 2 [Aphanothece hegewaldii CCALA 016]|uniref:Glycosyl transferase family 2 n=1 Tax=Aphanothece hegewaldii CCALA 016 TaxID=2107694 RepID=A0A2T1LV78_9CHRO|nr:glycosyltransferase family 2 protein [Aphanothece hegewaldii]PSF35526.1 glycosyl transferase family 2 [Aphanothece hegewaldii CCALA 016]